MKNQAIFLGNSEINFKPMPVTGQFVEIDGEEFYQIRNYHEMPDFFISIVSDSDHWMFISSNGSVSAGRKDRDNALFPYYTDDKIHDYKGKTGSRSYFLVKKDGKTSLWEPFTDNSLRFYNTARNIYKSSYGNKIIFEEINNDLGLRFRYGWYNSERFGFVKESILVNISEKPVSVDLLDGLKNVLPSGVGYAFQNEYSNLVDAYKKSEKAEDSSLGLFMLSAIPVDRAEPSEALFATSVWTTGLGEMVNVLVSEHQVNNFIRGEAVETEENIRGARGAYFVNSKISLKANDQRRWFTIAEINQSNTDVANLDHFILNTRNPVELILANILKGTENLKRMVSLADGFQVTNTEMCCARHYTNTLFNIMRGGVFVNNYQVDKADFKLYLSQINRLLSKEFQNWLEKLPESFTYYDLTKHAEKTNNADLIRIAGEYLPLTFSRRHGDPSRPWNRFSIETKNEDGSVKYYYEGNWRDIFQNWEALCYSFPEFTEGIISKFVNSSTIDGYNPYRIMRDGIDWEVPEPDDPWAYIGYWGDHQIIYLQKLLELSFNFHPGKLERLLTSDIYAYANVPYRIKPFEDIMRNPKDTVVFDFDLNHKIKTEAAYLGADASLLKNKQDNQIYRVNLTEKILVPLLSKLSNFIPEAGIWLNTQRPEWNDANNALVGNGTSMVTLYYLRRFLHFWDDKLSSVSFSSVSISEEVASLLENIHQFLDENTKLLNANFSGADRLRFIEFLGKAHAKYRNEIYTYSFSGVRRQIPVKNIVAFFKVCLHYIDHSIRANRRKDALYHAYNLISVKQDGIEIRHLYEMLEGQVAVLSSGLLSSEENLEVLNALKKSNMFREDQYSYMLYPNRILHSFMEKNWIPEELVESSALLKKLLADKNADIIQQDALGEYHFNSTFRNAGVLELSLGNLKASGYSQLVEEEKEKILAIYEEVFDHQSFTGRSGTFFGYEGLGSIYWHMVSKLLLAAQECFFQAVAEGASSKIIGQLKQHYYEIKAGIGLYKNPELYGAFPTDAHSHTPANSGAKQPGLTGQVKEDVIARLGELALSISNGSIVFEPALVNEEEILEKNQKFEFYSINGEPVQLSLIKGQIGFTFCLTPILLNFSAKDTITVFYADGSTEEVAGRKLNPRISSMVFSRNGEIERVEVSLKTKK
ncbi:MAG: hypothetical protein IH598_02850 [Bacteroidales bacterium]|nr:hypothetical protein [Bacteroidales bacterium]